MTTHQGQVDSSDWANSITDSYEELLLEQLQDPEWAIGYLNAALVDPDPRVFSLALQDVVKSQALLEPLGEDMATLRFVLEQLGFELRVAASSLGA